MSPVFFLVTWWRGDLVTLLTIAFFNIQIRPAAVADPFAVFFTQKPGGVIQNQFLADLFANLDVFNRLVVREIEQQFLDRKSTRLNSSHNVPSRMPSSA